MKTTNHATWAEVWRNGVAPLLSDKALTALADALRRNDQTLIQGGTTVPPPLQCVADWPVEAACLLGYCGWKGEDRKTVAEVEDFFFSIVSAADGALGEPAAVRFLLNYWDDTPREVAVPALLAEVEATIEERLTAAVAA